jgi:hypothetical protein
MYICLYYINKQILGNKKTQCIFIHKTQARVGFFNKSVHIPKLIFLSSLTVLPCNVHDALNMHCMARKLMVSFVKITEVMRHKLMVVILLTQSHANIRVNKRCIVPICNAKWTAIKSADGMPNQWQRLHPSFWWSSFSSEPIQTCSPHHI